MRNRILVTKYLLAVLLVALCVFTWQSSKWAPGRAVGTLVDAVTRGQWFPDQSARIKFGFPDTWRSPEPVNDEVIDPIAERTFYMLKTGAEVMWDRVPVHLETTFKRFPYHQIYSDANTLMGNESVVDVIEMVPEPLIGDWLVGYQKRRQQTAEAWGWASEQVRHENSEGWENDKFKNVPMMLHAFRNAPKHIDWFVFADDDTYIHSQSLGALLRDLNPNDKHYIGSAAMLRDAMSEGGAVGASLKAEKPDEPVSLWFAHGGSGYVVSRGAIDALFWDPQREDDTVRKYSEWAVQTCCGDAVFGFMLREELKLYLNSIIDSSELVVDPFLGEGLASTQISAAAGGWCNRLATWHHIEPWEIQKLYEWEGSVADRKPSAGDGVLFSDIYHDLILPYIEPIREFWDNGAATGVYSWDSTVTVGGGDGSEDDPDEDRDVFHPTESIENCQRACEVFPRCLGWKFEVLSPNNSCTVEYDNIRRGKSAVPLDGAVDASPVVVSGWMVDRIRAIRSGEVCDFLEYNLETEEYNDREEDSEGWYFRRLFREQKDSPEVFAYDGPA